MNLKLLPQEESHRSRRGLKNKEGKSHGITYSSLNLIFGEDNVVSTIDDLYTWAEATYTERMVRRATLEMAFTPGRTSGGKLIVRRIETQTGSYGFGWSIGSFEGNLAPLRAEVWSGFVRLPGRNITAVVFRNSSNDKMVAIARKEIAPGCK